MMLKVNEHDDNDDNEMFGFVFVIDDDRDNYGDDSGGGDFWRRL